MAIVFIIFAVLFFINMFCMYLVKDYRNGITYGSLVYLVADLKAQTFKLVIT